MKGSRILPFFKNRFSSEELVQIFVACSFPIHVWAIPHMLHDVPSWLLRFTRSELLGVLSYTFTFMLAESILAFLCILILGMLIPRRWLERSIVPFCFVLLIELTILAITLQYFTLRHILYRRLLFVIAVLLAIGFAFGISRIRKIKFFSVVIIERLTPLTFLYIFFDLIALLIVFMRNLGAIL